MNRAACSKASAPSSNTSGTMASSWRTPICCRRRATTSSTSTSTTRATSAAGRYDRLWPISNSERARRDVYLGGQQHHRHGRVDTGDARQCLGLDLRRRSANLLRRFQGEVLMMRTTMLRALALAALFSVTGVVAHEHHDDTSRARRRAPELKCASTVSAAFGNDGACGSCGRRAGACRLRNRPTSARPCRRR